MVPRPSLDPATFAEDPMTQFEHWFEDARARGEREPEACALASAGSDGSPSLRMVLLRGRDARGFVFFTNYESRKGRELAARPAAAMTFYWPSAERQVRIEGPVERVGQAESDAYFSSRQRESRLSAIASPQSRTLSSRRELEALFEEASSRNPGAEVPRPLHWGGFRLTPDRVEFWQTGAHRLHDRLCYRHDGGAWRVERLAP
jgi:pyridoxamine 5'-phosphate oxidase